MYEGRNGAPKPPEDEESGQTFMGRQLTLTEGEFHALRTLIYDRFGINLTDQKRTLVTGRLQRVLAQHKFKSFGEYIEHINRDSSGQALSELVNRISTNHTYFYREHEHFDFFSRHALPAVLSEPETARQHDLRIWCAGCSSGEEAYTLVMLTMESLGLEYSKWSAGLLATDVSENALRTAKAGIYSEDRVSPLPAELRRKYFRSAGSGNLSVVDRLKEEITFRRFNLMNEQFPFRRPFHIIFCRNVMIYFDQPTRDTLIKKYYDLTVPGGYLFIGHSETIRGGSHGYNYVMPAVYRKGV
jgi:chemotaxis protein methyltransferase CheR